MAHRAPPTLCVDCASPISPTAIRCRRCAGHRLQAPADVLFEPPPFRLPTEPGTRRLLTAEEVRWVEERAGRLRLSQVARLLDVRPSTVARIRTGERPPS